MANTLTNLIPDAYAALDIVSRELSGFIPSVLRDSSADQISAGQTLRVPIVPTATVSTITPAMSYPTAVDQAITNATLTLTKQREAKFSWSGSQQRDINAGAGYASIKQMQIAQAIRALVNEMETDIAAAAILGASRGYGTAGTAPFGTVNDYTDASNLHRILADNGAPMSNKNLIVSTAVGANLRGKQATSQNATEDSVLRQGVLLDVNGFKIRESYALGASFTKGTGAAYVLNGSHAVGATSVVVKTGTGTILAGDVITINGRSYVVATGVAAPGTVVINAPGLMDAGVDGNTVTLVATHNRAGVAFDSSSILLATRVPSYPEEGDSALLREVITDDRTGLSFEVSAVGGDRMVTFRVGAVWGVSVIKPAHSALLIG